MGYKCKCMYCTCDVEAIKKETEECKALLEELKEKGIEEGSWVSEIEDEVDFACYKDTISFNELYLAEVEKKNNIDK